MIQVFRVAQRLSLGPTAALVVATFHADLALAQLKPEANVGTRLPSPPREYKPDQTRQILQDFAVCVVDKKRSLASAYILDRTAFQFGHKYGRLADGDCLYASSGSITYEVGMKLDNESMRYALAEALLRNEIGTIDPATLSTAPVLPVPTVLQFDYSQQAKKSDDDAKKTPEQMRAEALAKIVMYKFGDCAVRANPVAARAMLQALPGSSAEGAAVQSLMPALGSCLEKGAEVKLNRVRLRGAIAVSYYSLAHAEAAPTH